MKRKFRKRKNKSFILASFLIVLTIPLAVYAILNIESLDTRNRASEGDIGYSSICNITFPYVNPETVAVDKTIQIQVDAQLEDEIISSVLLINKSGDTIFEKDYDQDFRQITELFEYTSTEIGDVGILGTITTDLGSYPCSLSQGSTMRILSANLAPVFKSTPDSAQPSNAIKVGDSYQYQLTAEDAENDTINYSYSFTPNADWLTKAVIADGGDGNLVLKLSGTPDIPASYLANVFIHDGYNAHLSSQSWVISVEQKDNDIPTVTVFEPAKDISVTKGDSVTVSWETSDLNKIVKYEIYISTNPGNENTWIPVDTNLTEKYGSYVFDTSNVLPGTYQFIVKATDNFSPPSTGIGLSPRIAIGTDLIDEQEGPDDGLSLQEAQIINISPSNKSDIKNKKATISATLIAASGEKIEKDTIKFKLEGNDLTDKLKLSDLSDSETTIIYTPEDDYTLGLHKVSLSFSDSAENETEREWTFEIVEDEESDDEIISIFGYDLPKRTVMIIAGGIVILILALVIPWLLYLAWKGNDDEDLSYTSSSSLPPTTPMTNSSYDSYYDYSSQSTTPETTTPSESTDVAGFGYTEPVAETTTPVEETTVIETPEPVIETTEQPIATGDVVYDYSDTDTKTETTSYTPTTEVAEPETPEPVVEPEVIVDETPKPETVVEETPVIEETPEPVVETSEDSELAGISELAEQLEQLKEEPMVVEETPEVTPIIEETPATTPQATTTFNAPKPNEDTSAK